MAGRIWIRRDSIKAHLDKGCKDRKYRDPWSAKSGRDRPHRRRIFKVQLSLRTHIFILIGSFKLSRKTLLTCWPSSIIVECYQCLMRFRWSLLVFITCVCEMSLSRVNSLMSATFMMELCSSFHLKQKQYTGNYMSFEILYMSP